MSSPSRTPSYLAILRTPHACRVFGAALLGRLSYGINPLSLVLALTRATGSYAVAGSVMALFALTVSVFAPIRAGLIDRYSPTRVLPPMAVAYALVLACLAAATWRPGAPGPLLGGLAVAAGVSAPPLGPVMRTLWSELLSDPALLRRGYSLDTVAEELLYVADRQPRGLPAPVQPWRAQTVVGPRAGRGVPGRSRAADVAAGNPPAPGRPLGRARGRRAARTRVCDAAALRLRGAASLDRRVRGAALATLAVGRTPRQPRQTQ